MFAKTKEKWIRKDSKTMDWVKNDNNNNNNLS